MAGDGMVTAYRLPIILGHRGASAEAPENTLAAFRLAVEQGADGVELDVWRCGSGEVVVHHDPDTARTGGVARLVSSTPWAELRRLDVGSWKGERYAGERIPLLAEVLDALPTVVVNVELKSSGWPDLALARAVAEILRGAGAEERCLVSSFDYVLLAAFRLAARRVGTGILFAGPRWRWRAEAGLRALAPRAVHPQAVLATPERVARWQGRGFEVNAWTVDDAPELARLAALGVSSLITNRPAAARAALRRAAGTDSAEGV
ncbi:MAG TPA: glycerophosphodiester phosphodiesterase [Anaeromyxobacteraceae bacterium]